MLKRWRFVSTSTRMHSALSKFGCKHPKGFKHGNIQGSVISGMAEYPMKLCTSMLASLFGWYECTLVMPCTPVVQNSHREKESDPSPPAAGFHTPPEGALWYQVSAPVRQFFSWKRIPQTDACVYGVLNFFIGLVGQTRLRWSPPSLD